jgi:arsenite-transporting ATPase
MEKGADEMSAPAPSFLADQELRLLLFGGKGGVGKTSCATAAALQLARNSPGAAFLLASTDPAHSVKDCLAGSTPPPNLQVIELDAQECLAAFKRQHGSKLYAIASRGTFLDHYDISRFLELSLPGLDELMASLEIARWAAAGRYQTIVVDTAPTGHTLRLLAMPALLHNWLQALDALLAKHRYMRTLFSGAVNRDEVDAFLDGLAGSVKQMEDLLRDSGRSRFVPVMLAEAMSLSETRSLLAELKRARVPVNDIVVNRLWPENECPLCADGRLQQSRILSEIFDSRELAPYAWWGLPLYAKEVRGAEGLPAFWGGLTRLTGAPASPLARRFHISAGSCHNLNGRAALPRRLESGRSSSFALPGREISGLAPRAVSLSPPHAGGGEGRGEEDSNRFTGGTARPLGEKTLLLFAGKGGVGKTTLACATSVRLAQDWPGGEVLLFSTDPAHSLADCLGVPVGPEPKRICHGLTALEIDAGAEFRALKQLYSEELQSFLRSLLAEMDLAFDREAMERIVDLSPPGMDEVMALTRVMDLCEQHDYHTLVLDSAPTGHLIRLLETPELVDCWLKVFFGLFLKYKQIFRLPKVSQRLVEMSRALKRLRALLADPAQCALCGVAILTDMAFAETTDLLAACRRMQVHAPLLFLNLATPPSRCRLCSALRRRESVIERKFRRAFPAVEQVVVYRRGEPRGLARLGELGQALYATPATKDMIHA